MQEARAVFAAPATSAAGATSASGVQCLPAVEVSSAARPASGAGNLPLGVPRPRVRLTAGVTSEVSGLALGDGSRELASLSKGGDARRRAEHRHLRQRLPGSSVRGRFASSWRPSPQVGRLCTACPWLIRGTVSETSCPFAGRLSARSSASSSSQTTDARRLGSTNSARLLAASAASNSPARPSRGFARAGE